MVDYIYKYESILRMSAFLGGFALLALWEWLSPCRGLTQNKRKRWMSNVGLVITSTLFVRVFMPVAVVGIAYMAEQRQLGIMNAIELPFALEFVVVYLLLDLSIYLQHVMLHVIPLFWRVHRVHHSDQDFDVSTGLRFHPVEIMLSILIKVALIILLGAPVIAVIVFEIVLNLMSMFTHSNIKLNSSIERVLRWFIVTPDMHRVHHSVKENETNSNFCFNISVWDRLFGTYIGEPEGGRSSMVIGLNEFRESSWQGLMGLLKMPFTSRIRGYAINYRDTRNADELAVARQLAKHNEEKAHLASELSSYMLGINQHALVSVTDTTGKIVDVNDKFCEISGYSREELIGQNHRVVNSGYHPNQFFTNLWSIIASGNKWYGQICNRAKDGSLYWVDSAIVPLKNSAGDIYRYLSVRIDITESKRQQQELRKAYVELEQANRQLQRISRIDGLTGIANRRHFDESLQQSVNQMRRLQLPLTLMLCDIDHFKKYNDSYGHQQGDKCLQQVAACIDACFRRAGDVVARYGGEEFAVILADVGEQDAVTMAQSLCDAIRDLKLEHASSDVAKYVTLSVGVTAYVPTVDGDASLYVKLADAALYRAKDGGRNNVQFLSELQDSIESVKNM